MLDLPPTFVKNVTQAFSPQGEKWLADLPTLLSTSARLWNLTIGEPFLLSYNYVCAVTRDDGTPAVLKIGVPNRELTSEINTLRIYNGRGACRLLEADADLGMLLMERLRPGTMLATLKNDDRATEIAADVMRSIQRPVSKGDRFISLRGWFNELNNLRSRFNGGTGPFPEKTVEIVERLVHDLFDEDRPQVLLHGDFHHFNILLSERGWLVIDPKGVEGPAEYEAGPLLMNPWGKIPNETEASRRTQRRIAILSERLGFDRKRLWAWAVCHSLLSAWWDLAANPSSSSEAGSWCGGEYSRAWTEIFLKTRI